MDRDISSNDPYSAQSGADHTSVASPPAPPRTIPDHQLLRRIGRGSYGEVWLARNMMGMYRAVKIVHRHSFKDHRPFERELSGIQKFEPLSRSHEGFVDVLHVGSNEAQGYFYYVMELGDDAKAGQRISPDHYSPKTLAREITLHGKLPFDECLKLGLALSHALAELHKHGLVHRDVKPSNIIFVHGVPKLADIGLVADVAEARSYVGTEGFIPPEGPGSPSADVYSLGKVLYEASTGKDRNDFPELPTLLDQFPDRETFLELNEVILHACKTKIRERYLTAWAMHSDLLVLANGKSVKRLKFLERRLATMKRTAGIAVVAALALTAFLYPMYRARRVAIEALQRQIGSNVAYGTRAVDSGNFLDALPYFAEALYLNQGARNQSEDRLRFGSTLSLCPKLAQMWFAPKLVYAGEFHPDGRHILTIQHFGCAQIFDLETGRPASPQFGPGTGLHNGTFSSDGKLVVTASEDYTAQVWSAFDGKEIRKLPHPDKVLSAGFSTDSQRVVTGSDDCIARIWNVASGKTELLLNGHTSPVVFAAFNHRGDRVATAARDGTVLIWDTAQGRPVGMPLRHSTWVNSADFSADDRQLITACFDHKAHVWEVASGNEIMPALNHDDRVNSAKFSPDGRFIVTGALDRTARLWLAADHQPVIPNPILRHSGGVTCASFAPDGRHIVTTCADHTVRVWDLATAEVASVLRGNSFSQDGRRYVASAESELQVRDTLTGQPVAAAIHCAQACRDVKLSAEGNFILTISPPEPNSSLAALSVFEAATGRPAAMPLLFAHPPSVWSLSRDGKRLLAAENKMARVWNVATGTPLSPEFSCNGNPASTVLSPDGTKVAAAGGGSEVIVLDAVTGRDCYAPLHHPRPVRYITFSPDNTRLVVCCADQGLDSCTAQIWDAATGFPVGPPLKHNDGVRFAAFSADGSRVVTASEDYTAIVWNAKTGEPITPPMKHHDQVQSAAFSPDRRWVATASSDKTARVWSAETGEPLTAPLQHPAPLVDVKFLSDGWHVVTFDRSGNTRIWKLSSDSRPNHDLRALSFLLSGGAITPAGESGSLLSGSLYGMWHNLRTNYPSSFNASIPEVIAWHEFQAEESQNENNRFAAAFHLQRLVSLQPNDLSLRERLQQVQDGVKEKTYAPAD